MKRIQENRDFKAVENVPRFGSVSGNCEIPGKGADDARDLEIWKSHKVGKVNKRNAFQVSPRNNPVNQQSPASLK